MSVRSLLFRFVNNLIEKENRFENANSNANKTNRDNHKLMYTFER
jgi:hypothetical protein